MEPGLFYHNEIKRDFDLADAAAKVAEKERPLLIKEARAAYKAAIATEFGKGKPVESTYGDDDFKVVLHPGVCLGIDGDRLDKTTKSGRAFLRIREINQAADDLCSIRCSLRDQMDTAMVNKFKAFVNALHGGKPTEPQLRQAVIDFRKQNAAHSCPIRKR